MYVDMHVMWATSAGFGFRVKPLISSERQPRIMSCSSSNGSPSQITRRLIKKIPDCKLRRSSLVAQEIACRRKIIDKLGNATDCHKEHLTNHCPFAPKVKLAMMNPMHPYQTDSPISSLDEWNRLFPGASPFIVEPEKPKVVSV
jgi:hypothetical protein